MTTPASYIEPDAATRRYSGVTVAEKAVSFSVLFPALIKTLHSCPHCH
jgi:hypothetical protein